MQLNATETDAPKSGTILRAVPKQSWVTVVAQLNVHIYQPVTVKIMVAKVFDSKSPSTALKFPNADYAAHQPKVNDKLKAAVVEYKIENINSDNGPVDINYDATSSGVFSFDVSKGGGKALDAIRKQLPPANGKIQVVIIRNMKSFYYLAKPANAGDKTITVCPGNKVYFKPGDTTILGNGGMSETVTIDAAEENSLEITLKTPLTKAHAAGEGIEFPAAGWSTTPILITEGNASEEIAKWTIIHEVGHRAFNFQDLDSPTDIMHFQQSWTDYRLRYCPQPWKYSQPPQFENQWEVIKR